MCKVCEGHVGCPCCEETPEICPICKGEGEMTVEWIDEDGNACSEVEKCETCNGLGYLEPEEDEMNFEW